MTNAHLVAGVMLVVFGGAFLLAAAVHTWLRRQGYRPSPVFKTVTPEERTEAEQLGDSRLQVAVRLASWLGLALLLCGVVVLAA